MDAGSAPPPTVALPYHSYTWIFAVTMIFSFLDAYAIGANDVANSFSTSVGARSIKLWQAVIIAIFTEFGGAVLLGGSTTATVKDGIIDTAMFATRPDLLMSGFMCALIGSSTWTIFASTMGWPIASTHATIGALIGIAVSGYGFDAVNWGWQDKGVAQIVTSWFASPVIAGAIAAVIYLITKYGILLSKYPLQRGIRAIPVYFILTAFIASFYVVSKNGRSTLVISSSGVSGDVGLCFGIIAAITAAVAIFCIGFLAPYFHRRLVKEERLLLWQVPLIWCVREQPHDPMVGLYLKQMLTPDRLTDDDKRTLGLEVDTDLMHLENGFGHWVAPTRNPFLRLWRWAKEKVEKALFMDVASVQQGSKTAIQAYEVAIIYDNKTEYLYSLLQVGTAAFTSFAHGSNDVANAIGPLAGVFQIWETGVHADSADTPVWMLAYAGVAIDLGFTLYGYNVMKNLGNNITYHSPSRGFCMELGTALAVLTASFLALPVSTTQCLVGATVAVGLCNGQWKAINWPMVAWVFFSWFVTLPAASLIAGLIYAFITRGPSFTMPPGA